MQLVAIIAIGIITGCGAYLAFDLSRFKYIVLGNHFADSHEDRLLEPAAPATPFTRPSPAPLQTAAAESPPLNNVTETERIAKEQENSGTPAPETVKPPAIPQTAGSHEDRVLKAPSIPTGNNTLAESQERARKAREISATRSSASLYSGIPTPPPKIPPVHQRHEAEASLPPPPAETPPPLKSPTKERGGGTEIAQDLRRFAADYLRTDENENVEAQAKYYAGSVHFYREGDLSWARIAAATQRYHRNSRQRRHVLSPASIRGPVDGGFWVVDQPFTWTKSDGIRTQTGRSVLRMRVKVWSLYGGF